MKDSFPRRFDDLFDWAREAGVTVEEARHRFAQFAALSAIANVSDLRESMVLKGGNALDFVWQPNRSTIDLDFSLDSGVSRFRASSETITRALEQGFRLVSNRLGVTLAVNSVRQHPPGEGRTFYSFTARVGYALPDEIRLRIRMANSQTSPHVLPIEISVNETIGEEARVSIEDSLVGLRVCTVEDIIAEKLRSLLQQPIRNRNRRQDVLDIAVAVTTHASLDRTKIARYLLLKSKSRQIAVSKTAFRHPDVRERAAVDYEALSATTRTLYIPFDEAFSIVLSLVDELPIPDT